jgi:hypothetical protein
LPICAIREKKEIDSKKRYSSKDRLLVHMADTVISKQV